MKKVRRAVRGQFVIIVALLIATLTLATAFSIYEININRQTMQYKPVNEFLLSTTSDMNRAVTVSLNCYTGALLDEGNLEQVAHQSASQFMDKWEKSLLTSYSSYGIMMNEPLNIIPDRTWGFDKTSNWADRTSWSSAYVAYDFDVSSYGFTSWTGLSTKYVGLQILDAHQFPNNYITLTFKLTQSAINQQTTVPIANLPSNPPQTTFRIGAYSPSSNDPTFNPPTSPSVSYQGNGIYEVNFDQQINVATQGIRLDLATPDDRIWVSAYTPGETITPGPDEPSPSSSPDASPTPTPSPTPAPTEPPGVTQWGTLYFYSQSDNSQNGILTPDMPQAGTGTKLNSDITNAHPTNTLSLNIPLGFNIKISNTATVTYYVSASQAIDQMTVELGFTYQNDYYLLGTSTINNIPKTNNPVQTIVPFNMNTNLPFTYGGFPVIPTGSTLTLKITVTGYNGRITFFYGIGTQSRIQF